jgi:hypothetical protein
MKIIYNCETGEVTERELNAEELEQQAIDQAAQATQAAAEAAKAAEKAAQRQLLLDRLGITQEEAQLLLGGN